jgi:uncharacterized protein (TIGR04255 family)
VLHVAIKLKNPPINELIIGAYFEPPLAQLHSEHVGVFWSSVRKEFPTIRQQHELNVPIAAAPSFQIGFTDEPYPMPRFWLIAEDDVMLLQIQKNAFLLNWRKREKEYPHFDKAKALFDRYLNAFQVFLKAELGLDQPSIQVVELTYSNLMEGDVWRDATSLETIFPGMKVPDIGLSLVQKPDINYVTAYKVASDLVVNLTIRSARQMTDASKTALIFEFRAVGVLESPDRNAADEWYIRAHHIIGRCFTAVTSDDIRRTVWQPE